MGPSPPSPVAVRLRRGATLCSAPLPRHADGSKTSGSVTSTHSQKLPSMKPWGNGTSASWHLSPSSRLAPSQPSLTVPRQPVSQSPALPRRYHILGPSKSGASNSSNKRLPNCIGPDALCEPVSSVIEPVCGTSKRKLKNDEQRPALPTHRIQAREPEKCRSETPCTSLTCGNVGGSHSPTRATR